MSYKPYINASGGPVVYVGASTSSQILIDAQGDLGIGTTDGNADYKLEVIGNSYISGDILSSGNITATSGNFTFSTISKSLKTGIQSNADDTTITFDLNVSNLHFAIVSGNRTLAVSNPTVGQRFLTRIQQDSTGSRTVTWWNNINWAGNLAPTLTTTALKADLLGFITSSGNGGQTYYDGFAVAYNL